MEMPVELGVRQDQVENQAIKFLYLLKREKILENSPQKNEEFFVVPKVIE